MCYLLEQLLYSCALGSALAYLTFIWFQTTFVVEYSKLFGLSKFTHEQEWEDYYVKNVDNDPQYPVFLREKYHNWITKMAGCPFCFIGFTSLMGALIAMWFTPIAFWACGPVSFLAATGFLLLKMMYKNIYLEKK